MTPSTPAASIPAPPPALRLAAPAHVARLSPLARWHLLSLDAPTVAALWTWTIAAAAHVHLPWQSPLSMFLAVWILYAADRLLDTRTLQLSSSRELHPPLSSSSRELPPPPSFLPDLEARHLFHRRHRAAFLAGIALASLALAPLLLTLPLADLRLDAALAALLAAYFVAIHATPAAPRLPKELAVGLFFAAAVFLPTVARAPGLRLALLPSALLLAALCTLNCLAIHRWEHEPLPRPALLRRSATHFTVHHSQSHHPSQTHLPSRAHRLPQTQSPPSRPLQTHRLTQLLLPHLRTLHLALIAAALTPAAARHTFIPLAIALSAAALLLLHRNRHHLHRTDLRAAADLALLTPLCLLPWL